jgi:tRNA 2-selenouridine synthase
MIEKINITQLFDYQKDRVVIDVRSPAEYEQGHIVGALNLPLFTNEERAIVGTIYKKQSPEKALLKGLDFVGRKMPAFIKKAQKIAPEKRLIVHCWRGGKRSGSMAWLLDLAGFDVVTLVGGYKAYRTHVLEYFEQPLRINVIGGKTGTGKTEILQYLQEFGAQIIDLEALANHKGSAFGSLGENPQPSSEYYESLIFEKLRLFDLSKKIWVENESRNVGKVTIPQGLWNNIKSGTLINIEIPHDLRIQRSVEDYKKFSKEALIPVFKSIERKLGGLQCQKAIQALENDDYTNAAEIALAYYDKTYQFGLDNNITPNILRLTYNHADMQAIAKDLMTLSL